MCDNCNCDKGWSKQVEPFTRACGDYPDNPKLMTDEQKKFIREMVTDELDELDVAHTIVDQADALIDVIYYTINCAQRHGVDLDPLFKIVCEANNSKIVDGKVIRREDGKIMKPKGWVAPEPQLEKEIDKQIVK